MKHLLKNASRFTTVLVLFAGLALAPARANAQLLEVKQTVFGMDCAPCAYGLEKRLKKFDGVTKARVSLNEGLASTDLAKHSRIKLSMIREAIRESGFSAEDAVIRAAGTLRQEGSRWIFELPSGEHFVVQQTRTDERASQALKPGRVTITGRVAKDDPDERGGYRLELLTVGTS